jgi:hypothetical protein
MDQWWREPALVVDQSAVAFYTCNICTLLLHCPVEVPCHGGHMYCRECWVEYAQWGQAAPCPECRHVVDVHQVHKSLAVRRFIEHTLKLACPCGAVLTMGVDGADARAHTEASCAKEPCGACHQPVAKSALEGHAKSQCVYLCAQCDTQVLHAHQARHAAWHFDNDAMEADEKLMAEVAARVQERAARLLQHDPSEDGPNNPLASTARVITIDVTFPDNRVVHVRIKESTSVARILRAVRPEMREGQEKVLYYRGVELTPAQTVKDVRVRDGDDLFVEVRDVVAGAMEQE